MSRSKKISWKLLVLIALVSSFIFCSEVCADNCTKKAVQTEQKDEVKEAEEVVEVEEVKVEVEADADADEVEVEVEEDEVEVEVEVEEKD